MYINTTGIVLREVKYGDSGKILTVLTSSEGKLTVSAYGAHRKCNKLAAGTGLYVFSHMTLTRRRDRWSLTEAQPIEQFLGLRDDLRLLALAAYIAELTETVADEDSQNPQLLSLCLNALYALSEKLKPPMLVKPAFELRLMALAGYAPVLVGERDLAMHSLSEEGLLGVSTESLDAARYIMNCDAKKLYSFALEGKSLEELAVATEEYLLTHLDRRFKTLDYYRSI